MNTIFGNIVNLQHCTWFKEFINFDDTQSGSRKDHSTIDNIFVLQSIVQKYITKPVGRFHVLYFYFQKAFDGILLIN